MNTSRIARIICIVATTTALVGVGSAAQARPDPGPTPTTPYFLHRPLERVGTQFVRGDDLTGNGVKAPLWISER
ncbi:MAG: hypothetical protein ABIO48_11590 [Pedococcus sp.]